MRTLELCYLTNQINLLMLHANIYLQVKLSSRIQREHDTLNYRA